jgi:tRNA A37 methylthiotransferase MiaB
LARPPSPNLVLASRTQTSARALPYKEEEEKKKKQVEKFNDTIHSNAQNKNKEKGNRPLFLLVHKKYSNDGP